MQGQIKECWRGLCERAVNEQDPAKFLVIVREINVLLERKTGGFKQRRPQFVLDAPNLPRCSLCDKSVLLKPATLMKTGRPRTRSATCSRCG